MHASSAPVTARRIGLFLIALVLVFPLFAVKYPPLVDYPDHLARSYILHHLHDSRQVFSGWYAADWGPNPYLVVDFLLQALQYPFGIYLAGRLLLAICVLSVPLATWVFLRQASPGNEYMALWALVVAYDTNFLMGFLSFQLSMAFCLIVIAAWLAYLRAPRLSVWLLVALLVTVLYFTHIGGFGVAGIVLVVYTWFMRRRFVDVCHAALLFVPGILFFLYVKMLSWPSRRLDYSSWHLSAKVATLATPFRGYSRWVDLLALLLFATALFYALYKNRTATFSRVWFMVAAVILLVHAVLPERYGDLASIDTRFPPFVFLLALAIPSLGKRKSVMIYAALAAFLIKTANVNIRFQSEQRKLDTLASGISAVPQHARVLACSKAPPPTDHWVEHSEIHFWAYGVISQGWTSPSLFHQKGLQPLVLSKDMYLGADPDGSCALDPSTDWQRLRRDYDFVWIYDVPALAPGLSTVSTPAFVADRLVIYRIRRDAVASDSN